MIMTNDERKLERKQITLRIPDEVYGALEAEAKEKGISVNDLILLRINPLNVDFQGELHHVLFQKKQRIVQSEIQSA